MGIPKNANIDAEINIIAVRASSLARDQNHLVDIGLKKSSSRCWVKKLSSRCWVSERGRSHYGEDEILITLILVLYLSNQFSISFRRAIA